MRLRSLASMLGLAVILSACGGVTAAPPTAQGVINQFKAAGIDVGNVTTPEAIPNSPLPQSFKEHLVFTVPRLGDKGGQVFVCDTKQNCDGIFAYFDTLKGLAGPYLYQSAGGTVVAQLNSGLTPDEAAKFEQVVEGIQ